MTIEKPLQTRQEKSSPWLFVPSLYFAEGLIYILVNSTAVIFYKRMGISNALIGATSFLYLPWVLKMLWGPLVDLKGTKRRWIVVTEGLSALGLLAFSASLHLPHFFWVTVGLLLVSAFFSATHDIAADGFYMLALTPPEQAYFVGIRSLFYRMAMLFGTGALVYATGLIEKRTGNIPLSWTLCFLACSGLYIGLSGLHQRLLPRPAADGPNLTGHSGRQFLTAFASYFSQKGVVPVIGFILLYRFGEALLVKMVAPFLLDATNRGGLGLSTSDVGVIYGTVGLLSLMAGGILGGMAIAHSGLKKWLWPMAVALNAPDLFYVYMASAKPDLPLVYLLVGLEQFGYGFGFSAFTVVLIYYAKGPFKTSHYAISTGIMALGMMVPGLVSGLLQEHFGYVNFFWLVCLATLPGMATILFLPKLTEES